jgi:hypothetical protein
MFVSLDVKIYSMHIRNIQRVEEDIKDLILNKYHEVKNYDVNVTCVSHEIRDEGSSLK